MLKEKNILKGNTKNKENKGNKGSNKNSKSTKNAMNMSGNLSNNAPKLKGPIIRDIYIAEKDLYNKIGILDPEGKNPNPITGLSYTDSYRDHALKPECNAWSLLPVYQKINDVIWTVLQ